MKSLSVLALGAIAVAAIAGFSSLPASAAVIAYDSFTYDTTSTAALNARNGGTGWTSAWSNSPSATVTAMNITNATLSAASQSGGPQAISVPGMSSTSGTTVAGSRQFASQTGNEVWFSFLFRTPSVVDSNDFLQFSLNDNTAQDNSASIGDTDTSASGGNNFSVRIGTTNGGVTVPSSKTIANSTDYFLVGRVSKAGTTGGATVFDLVEMWVNPLNPFVPDASSLAISSDASSNMTQINYFTFRTANFNGTPYLFDELRIGTDYNSVLPEPTGLATFAVLGLGLLRRKRRR